MRNLLTDVAIDDDLVDDLNDDLNDDFNDEDVIHLNDGFGDIKIL